MATIKNRDRHAAIDKRCGTSNPTDSSTDYCNTLHQQLAPDPSIGNWVTVNEKLRAPLSFIYLVDSRSSTLERE